MLFQVVGAFAFRLGVAALFIAYLESYEAYRHHGRKSIGAVNNIILQQMLLAWALISSTIPCTVGFLSRFQTGDLAALSDSGTRYGYGSNGPSQQGQSYVLSSMDRPAIGRTRRATKDFVKLQPDNGQHSAQAYAGAGGDDASMSVRTFASDELMIINKRVDISVS